jgi:hypothetical protein
MPCMLLPAVVLVAVAVVLFAAVAGRCRIRTHQAGVRQRNLADRLGPIVIRFVS